MADDLHSFRCPVCGHADEIHAEVDEITARCAHCATALILGPVVKGRMPVEARVSEGGGRRRGRARRQPSQ